MKYDTSDSQIKEYKFIDPQTLEACGLLFPARKTGYVCPACGNGTGSDGTGVDFNLINDGYKGYCFNCHRHFDVFDLIAIKHRYNLKTQFADVVDTARQYFNDAPPVRVERSEVISKPKINVDKAVRMKLDKPVANYELFLRKANQNLKKLFAGKETFRALTFETLNKFFCGYTSKFTDGLPRLIIPTSFHHYLARLIGKNPDPNKFRDKPHFGQKDIFGKKFALEALEENPNALIFAVEGEIDAMSIWQSGFFAIAFGGSQPSKYQRTLFPQFPQGSKVILMPDADETGKEQLPINHNILTENGFCVYDAFLDEKFHDSNDWLQADADGLKVELQRICDNAKKFFAENPLPEVKKILPERKKLSIESEKVKSDEKKAVPKVEKSEVEVKKTVPKVENPPVESENPLPEGIKRTDVDGIVEITPDYKPTDPVDSNSKVAGDSDDEAYIKTCSQIANCPLDLSIPKHFKFTPAGIFEKVKDKKTGEDLPPVIISHTPVIPTRLFAKKDGTDMQVEIAVYDRLKNVWKKHIVPKTTVANSREIVNLASLGVSITSGRARGLSNFLTDIQSADDNAKFIPRVLIYEKPGWTDEKCEIFIYPPGTNEYIVQNCGFDYESKFRTKGEKDVWLTDFSEIFDASVAARYAIGLVLAAPLVNLCKSRNFQGVLIAPSGSSKSAVAKFAMSIFGDPNKLKVTFNGTPNFLDEISTRLNDLPVWIDEFQSADKNVKENFSNVVMNYAEGKSRGRLSKNADTKKQFEFKGTRICTAEQAVLQSNFTQGTFSRTFEIETDKILPARFGADVHRDLEENFGFFGKIYIDYIIAHKKEIQRTYQGIQDKFRKWQFIPAHLEHISLAYTGATYFVRMLKERGDMKFDLPDPLETLYKGDIKYFRELLPTPRESNNIVRAREFLAELLVTHQTRFASIFANGKYEHAAMGSEIGIKFADGSVAFYPKELGKILAENNYPQARDIMRGLDREGLMIKADGDLGRQFKNFVTLDGRSTKIYRVKSDAFNFDA